MRESVLELDEKVKRVHRDCPSIITKCKKNRKDQVSGRSTVCKRMCEKWKPCKDVDQARGDTHREVGSCTRLFLEKDEMEVCRSSAKEYSGVSRSARR